MPARHRYANDLADAELHDAAAVVEAGIFRRIGEEHTLLLAQNPVDDGPTQENLLFVLWLLPSNGPRLRLPLVARQHHAAAVGWDRTEDEFEETVEELRHVEDMADCLARLVDDREIGDLVLHPRRRLLRIAEDMGPRPFVDRLDDRGGDLDVAAGDHADLLGEIAGRLGRVGAEDEQRLPDADAIARFEDQVGDLLVVDVGAVRGAEVDDAVGILVPAKLGMAARDFSVVQPDAIAGVPADAENGLGHLELPTFVDAFENDQSCQRSSPGRWQVRAARMLRGHYTSTMSG